MITNIQGDFQICVSVILSTARRYNTMQLFEHLKKRQLLENDILVKEEFSYYLTTLLASYNLSIKQQFRYNIILVANKDSLITLRFCTASQSDWHIIMTDNHDNKKIQFSGVFSAQNISKRNKTADVLDYPKIQINNSRQALHKKLYLLYYSFEIQDLSTDKNDCKTAS